MNLSAETRATAKEAQLARLGAKGTPEYAELYAAQPDQVAKRSANRIERAKDRARKQQANDEAAANAAGSVKLFGQAGTKKAAKKGGSK